jgi:acyl-CoA hydrolase
MKLVSLSTALDSIDSGMRIWVQGMASTPHQLLQGLAERSQDLHDVTVLHLHLEGDTPWVTPDLSPHVRDISLFVGSNLRHAVNTGLSDYLPIFLSEVPLFLEDSEFRPDVAFVNVSPPDQHGFVSLGPTIEATLKAMQVAPITIAQINPKVPRVLGDAQIPADSITYGVEVDEALNANPILVPDPLSLTIGRQVAALIPDRAVLQVGIGRIPDAVLSQLTHHRDLGIHSEMISDGVRRLAEQGVVSGRYKGTDVGFIVATFAMGSDALYQFLDDNPGVLMRPVDYTNNTSVIRRNPRMISINSAIEVDLTGQVVAESIGSRIVSGVGGQMDFVRGASLAPGGRSIIALPARTRDGQPRIVADIHAGAAVTTTRNHVQYVVTEYGVAELHGRTLAQRAHQLIAVAHPDDREELARYAKMRLARF